jgi:hypothetical protein
VYAFDDRIEESQTANSFEVVDLQVFDLWQSLQRILVDGLNFVPVVLDGDLLEVGFDLVGPCALIPLHLLGVDATVGVTRLPVLAHLVVLGDEVLYLPFFDLLHVECLWVLLAL